MSNVAVANIRGLEVGKSVNVDRLNDFINNQSYTLNGDQVIGEVALWSKGGPILETCHAGMAPEGTCIQLREHYYGDANLVKHNGKWVVTRICLR